MRKYISYALLASILLLSNMAYAYKNIEDKIGAAVDKKQPARQQMPIENRYDIFSELENYVLAKNGAGNISSALQSINYSFKLYLLGIFPNDCLNSIDSIGPKAEAAWKADLVKHYAKKGANFSNQSSVKELGKLIGKLQSCKNSSFLMLKDIDAEETTNNLISDGIFRGADRSKLLDILQTLQETNHQMFTISQERGTMGYTVYVDDLDELPAPAGVNPGYFAEDSLFAYIDAGGFNN